MNKRITMQMVSQGAAALAPSLPVTLRSLPRAVTDRGRYSVVARDRGRFHERRQDAEVLAIADAYDIAGTVFDANTSWRERCAELTAAFNLAMGGV